MEASSEAGTSEIIPKKEAMEQDEEEEEQVVAPSLEVVSLNSVQKCVFCSGFLTPSCGSKLLDCLHAVCLSCVNNWTEEPTGNLDAPGPPASAKECPECRLAVHPSSLIENKFLEEVIGGGGGGGGSGGGGGGGDSSDPFAASSGPTCNCNPENPTPATDWCETCREFICQTCTVAHKQLVCTKDHVIRPKEEGDYRGKKRNENYPCSNHPKEFLVVYCTDCEVMTCRDCQLLYHREHKHKFIKEIANDTKVEMKTLLNDILYKVEILNGGITVLDERTKKIQDKKQEIAREINKFVRRTNELATKAGKELLAALNQACSTKLKSQEEHREALAILSKQATHCTEFVGSALQASSDNCLVYSKKRILDHLNRMKQKKSQIPYRDYPIQIQLMKSNEDIYELFVQNFLALRVENHLLPPNSKHKHLENLLTLASQKMNQIKAQHQQQQQQQQQQGAAAPGRPPGGVGPTQGGGPPMSLPPQHPGTSQQSGGLSSTQHHSVIQQHQQGGGSGAAPATVHHHPGQQGGAVVGGAYPHPQQVKPVQQQQPPQSLPGVTITPRSSMQQHHGSSALSPSLQGLQNQLHLQQQQAMAARGAPTAVQQPVIQQGQVNPLRQQQVTSSTHPQRPQLMRQPSSHSGSSQGYMRNPSPDQGMFSPQSAGVGGGGGGYSAAAVYHQQQQAIAAQQQQQRNAAQMQQMQQQMAQQRQQASMPHYPGSYPTRPAGQRRMRRLSSQGQVLATSFRSLSFEDLRRRAELPSRECP